MAFEVQSIMIDVLQDTAVLTLRDVETGTHVFVNGLTISAPGHQPEHRLQDAAKAAARQVLKSALAVL